MRVEQCVVAGSAFGRMGHIGLPREIEQAFYHGHMGANPSKRDKWPPPKSWRHVWMAGETQYAMPHQALVLDWREDRRGRWSALVKYVDESPSFGPALRGSSSR